MIIKKILKKIKLCIFDLFLIAVYWNGKLEGINKLLFFFRDNNAIYILKKFNANIGMNVGILPPLIVHSHNKNCNYKNIIIGNNCRIGRGTLIDIANKIEIQNNVVISMGVTLLTHMDVGTSPLASNPKYNNQAGLKIENGVYIGANATVLCGITIGRNAIVGAGAVVTKNIDPFSIVAGVPAKLIGKVEHGIKATI